MTTAKTQAESHDPAISPLDERPPWTASQAQFDAWMSRRGPRCTDCGGTLSHLPPHSAVCSC